MKERPFKESGDFLWTAERGFIITNLKLAFPLAFLNDDPSSIREGLSIVIILILYGNVVFNLLFSLKTLGMSFLELKEKINKLATHERRKE